jgi:hypothetical protein
LRRSRACAGSALLALLALARPDQAAADDVATALYVRTDSDSTTVVSPRVHANKSVGESTQVDATYAADVWTSASIDIRTSASVQRVTEQRDELDVSVAHAFEDVALHVGYRLSIENDYDSNGLSAGLAYDFADNAARLELSVNAFHDIVGRSGQPDFARRLDTVNSRLSFTQVLDPSMFAQLTYELAWLDGYQASPYRYVPIASPGIGCEDGVPCLPERVPDRRLRHAFALTLRRALGAALSIGATYRMYLDDWALRSHTALAELGWNAGEHTLLALRLRYYTQGAVDFYEERYTQLPAPDAFLTHDRELSAMSAERVGLELEQGIPFDAGAKTLRLSLSLAGALFHYDEFVGLSSVRALEVTTALVLSL